MTTATTKFQVSAAALAVAAAAAVTPVVAQADSFALAPSLTSIAQSLGSSAGSGLTANKTTTAKAGIQTKWLWTGTPNPSPPSPQIPVWTFKPLNAVAWIPFLGPGSAIWNWWDQQYSQTCIFGISTFVGPYGTTPQYSNPGKGSITRQWSPNGCK